MPAGMRNKDSSQDVSSETVYRLKLKSPDHASFSPSVQILESEYGSRYLEGLGVAPSRATLDLVHKNIPLSKKCLNTTLRSKGHVNDEIQITVPPLTHQPKVPQVINPHAVLQLGLNTQEAGVLGVERVEDAQAAADAKAGKLPEPKPSPGSKFRQLAAKFLHPFNLDVNSAHKQLTGLLHDMGSAQAQSTAAAAGEDRRPLARPTESMQRSTSASMLQKSALTQKLEGWQIDGRSPGREEVVKIQTLEEMLQELIVTPEVILVLQTQIEGALLEWHTHTAAETFKGRLSNEEFQATLELLVSDSSISFFITLINFMHEEFVRNSPSFPHHLVRKLRHEGNMDSSNHGHTFSKDMSKRTSFMGGAAGGNAVEPNKQLVALAEHDLGWEVWSSERDFACKQAELEAEKEAASLEAKKFSSLAGSLYSNPAFKSQRTVLSNPSLASTKPSANYSAQANASSPRLPQALRPVHSNSFVLSQPSSLQASSHTHSRIQGTARGTNNSSNKQPVISFATEFEFPSARKISESDPHTLFDTKSQSSSSSEGCIPNTTLSTNPDLSNKRVKPVSTLHYLDEQDMLELQQARLFVLQREFNALYKRQRGTRAGMFFTLPVFLVASRLLVYLLFSSLFRLWVQSDEGLDALEKMDKSIVYLFDPSGYLQRSLTILESSSAAVSIMTKHPQLGHGPERVHLSDVSPLMRAAMQQPACHQTRKLLVDGAKHKPSRHATNTNRVVNAAGAAAIAGAEIPPDYSFQGSLPGQGAQQPECPLRTKLTLEQTDALYREAHAGILLEGVEQVSKPSPVVTKRRDQCMPAIKKKS